MNFKSLMHLNGNILCAIDVETTGFIPGFHDVWQIAILPLNSEIRPAPVIPFYVDLKIKRPENIEPKAVKLNRTDFFQRQLRALDPWTAADMFDEWVQKWIYQYTKVCVRSHRTGPLTVLSLSTGWVTRLLNNSLVRGIGTLWFSA